ncbi:MAG: MarR family transcriptional regulator [Acidimicrobiia bacterium]|nr:MarR family transcriptional regulator [Acidimicrobiia bacterium]
MGELRPPLDALLLLLVDRMSGVIRERVEACGLSMPQAVALRYLEQPCPMRNLARAMRCDASNLTGIADRLEERGLAVRRLDPDDRRVKLLVLTESGLAMRAAIHRRISSDIAGLERLGPAERELLAELLWRVVRE